MHTLTRSTGTQRMRTILRGRYQRVDLQNPKIAAAMESYACACRPARRAHRRAHRARFEPVAIGFLCSVVGFEKKDGALVFDAGRAASLPQANPEQKKKEARLARPPDRS